MGREANRGPGSWLLLIHQIPPKPDYFRVKVGRHLQRLGAVALKNSVYVLPFSEQAQEDFEWLAREIVEGGGDASVCNACFLEGVSDGQIEALFHAARDADFEVVGAEACDLLVSLGNSGPVPDDARAEAEAALPRLKRRLAEIIAIDHLGAPGRLPAESHIGSVEERLSSNSRTPEPAPTKEKYVGRTWVTRSGIHVDRMASGWLIRRFIDPKARFKFVSAKGHRHKEGELRFDMFQAEFTHEGDRCTFEVLLGRFGLNAPGLRAIGEIVHDLDLKDAKFGRQDALGIDRLIAGIAMGHKEDEVRLERACAVFDDLCEYFKHKRPVRAGGRS